jgi:hypothetical protein
MPSKIKYYVRSINCCFIVIGSDTAFSSHQGCDQKKTSDLPDFVANSFSTGGATDLFSNWQSDYFLTII